MSQHPREARWNVTAYYRSEAGEIDVVHPLEELADLPALVEAGPHWSALVRIEILLNPERDPNPGLTVEAANDPDFEG